MRLFPISQHHEKKGDDYEKGTVSGRSVIPMENCNVLNHTIERNAPARYIFRAKTKKVAPKTKKRRFIVPCVWEKRAKYFHIFANKEIPSCLQ